MRIQIFWLWEGESEYLLREKRIYRGVQKVIISFSGVSYTSLVADELYVVSNQGSYIILINSTLQ
jgi:hypothetical protein